MKLLPLNKNSLALITVAVLSIGFFISGLMQILDYFIVKVLLFGSFGILIVIAISYAFQNEAKKNRPEELPQDDLH
ncbi:hypothetical protein [Winogradskyella tangerina]|uniref:hypothetical protein n=1 Tax=Winogradskyella tangerina TaxID=2023240 RepID=UPI000DBE96B2|nr:hypothetical protein [Winogradskyella tangerina]